MNLCQPAYNTPDGCPKEAAVCRVTPDGTVDVLGMVYTQQLRAYGKERISRYFCGGLPKMLDFVYYLYLSSSKVSKNNKCYLCY